VRSTHSAFDGKEIAMCAQSALDESMVGKIVARGINIDCVICDLSESAAIVSTTCSVGMPSKVYLWQRSSATVFECDVQWRKDPDLFGLKFCEDVGKIAHRSTVIREFE
jgi:hypothetical protein